MSPPARWSSARPHRGGRTKHRDGRACILKAHAASRDFYNVYTDTFDYLYRYEAPSLLNLTVHAHFGGRPLMSAMLQELLRYMRGYPDVWFARHDEVARWTIEQAET